MARMLGIAPLTHLELTPPQMVDNAAAAGFDALGLRLIPATAEEPQHDSQGDTPLVRETARRLQGSGLRLLDIEILRLQPETRVADYAEAGALLGARHALVAPQDADPARLADKLARPAARMRASSSTRSTSTARATRRSVLAAMAALTPGLFRYAQLCDAPAERPREHATLLHQARAERLMPGDGGLNLAALPPDIPLSLEIPMHSLAQTLPVLERARRMRARPWHCWTAWPRCADPPRSPRRGLQP